MKPTGSKEVHLLAACVHGALIALHTLGLVYNLRRKNRWQSVAHVAGIAFSVHSVVHHIHEAHEQVPR